MAVVMLAVLSGLARVFDDLTTDTSIVEVVVLLFRSRRAMSGFLNSRINGSGFLEWRVVRGRLPSPLTG